MDLSALMGTLLSSDSIESMSKKAEVSEDNVKSVLANALPSLLNGVQEQACGTETAEGFLGALGQHAQVDTNDIASFFSNVDVEDGGKIVTHLLGANTEEATQQFSERAGLGSGKTALIMALAAPLLMSLLGQQQQQTAPATTSAGIGSLMSGLLGGGNTTSLLGSLLGGGYTQPVQQQQQSGGLLSGLLNLFRG